MKKKVLFIFISVIVSLSLFACTAAEKTQSEEDLTISEMYAAAVGLGFQGSLREFLNLVKGEDGVGIAGIRIDGDGRLVVETSDGKTTVLDKVRGENGADGRGIAGASVNASGELIVILSDGAEINCGAVAGKEGGRGEKGDVGDRGETGEKGADGRGIESFYISGDGYLIVRFTDSPEEILLGKIKGEDGKDGTNGQDGTDGKDGTNGKDGINGRDGADGRDGIDGKDGTDGRDGLSAYEIYVKYHPEYTESEREWIEALAGGRLNGGRRSVTVICGPQTHVLTVNDGDTADLSAIDTSRTGYEFVCWTVGEEIFDPASPVFEDVVLTAFYKDAEIDEYTEAAALYDVFTMDAMTRIIITLDEINIQTLKFLTFEAECGKIEVKIMTVNGEDMGSHVFGASDGDCVLDASAYSMTEGGYVLDITYRSDAGALTVTPSFA